MSSTFFCVDNKITNLLFCLSIICSLFLLQTAPSPATQVVVITVPLCYHMNIMMMEVSQIMGGRHMNMMIKVSQIKGGSHSVSN